MGEFAKGDGQELKYVYICILIPAFMEDKTIPDIEKLKIAAGILKSIAHPMRIAILNLLKGGKKTTVTEIQELLGIEQASTSHHLGILRDRGVLSSRRDGKNTWYYLKNDILNQVVDCVNRCTCTDQDPE